jgi:outer membrane protein assembly factor BamA
MRKALVLAVSSVFVCTGLLAEAQKYSPRSIQFKGAPQYTQEELLAAAGLKPGMELTTAEMGEHAKTLLGTGVFEKLSYNFNGQDLVYQLSPSGQLLPIKLVNLPPVGGLNIDATLRAKVPLYHGAVPADGGLTDQVRTVLEQELASKGMQASIIAAASSGATAGAKPVENFSVVSPDIQLGAVTVDAASVPLEPGALSILKHLEGSPYDVDGSPDQLATYLNNYYHDEGYLEVKTTPRLVGATTKLAEAIRVPFTVSVAPGPKYRLNAIHLDPSLLATQADFDKHAALHRGDIAGGQSLTKCWEYIALQYHNHGFMKPSVHPEATFDRANAQVNFSVTADPGEVYTMGKLTIENVSTDLRAAILAAWTVPPGTVFNEGAVRGFFATNDVKPALERVFAASTVKYLQTLDDNTRTVNIVLKLEPKH